MPAIRHYIKLKDEKIIYLTILLVVAVLLTMGFIVKHRVGVVNAQQYNITPYNTVYMYVVKSPPVTGWSEYNPNVFQGGIWWYGVYQQFLAAVNITTGKFTPLLAENWSMIELPNGTLEVLIHLRHSGWDNGIPVTCWDVYATNMLLGLVSAMVGNVTIFNNYTCAFMIPKGYYAPLTVPGASEANAFIALEWGQGIAIDWQDSYVWEPIINMAQANYSWIWLYMFGNSTEKGEAAKVLSTLIHDYLTYKPTSRFGYSNGPYYLCDITPEYFLLCKNPYYYDVNKFVPQYIVEWQYSSMSQVYAALASGKISIWSTWSGALTPSILSMVSKNPYIKILVFPAFGGDAIYFNFLNPWLAMPQVRQAIYYAVNWTQLAEAAYGMGFTFPSPMPQDGLMPYYTEWQENISKYWAAQGSPLINYTYNPGLAAQLLESVGFKKVNGIWYTPNGSQFTLTLYIGSGSSAPQLTLANAVANALTSFGIPTTVIVYPAAEGLTVVEQGKYDLLWSYYSDIYRPGIPYYFPEAFYFIGYPFNYSHWNGIVTLPNGTTFSVPECGVKITTNCIYRVAWAINHDPWYIQVDWNGGVVFLNTQYINWPINDTWIWIGTLQHTTPAWTYLFQLISFKPPTTTATTTTSPVVTTVSTTTTVTSTTTVVTSTTVVSGTTTTYTTTSTVPVTSTVTSTVTATVPPTTVTVTKPVISTALVVGIVVIVVVVAAVAAVIALRRR